MVIKGSMVSLRPATTDDRRKIFEWLAHSDITSSMMGPPDFADNAIPEWEYFVGDYNPGFFNDDNPDDGRSYIIEVENEEAGHINYNEIDRVTNTVELDIWMAGSRYCGKGYGPDAIDALCQFLENHLRCVRFILAPSARNTNAIKAYKKCGFRISSEVPRNFIPDYHDTVVMIRK